MIGIYLVVDGVARGRFDLDESKPLGEEIKRHFPNVARVVKQNPTTLAAEPASLALPLEKSVQENGIKENDIFFAVR